MSAEEEYMSFDEKVALSQVVEKLPVNEHHYVYRIVLEGDPSALEDCEDDPAWTYVEFNILKPPTLKALEGYIASRDANTQSEIQENNPVPQSEKSSESTTKAVETPSTKSKASDNCKGICPFGKKASAAKAEKGSIKARLRTPKSSGTGMKKQD